MNLPRNEFGKRKNGRSSTACTSSSARTYVKKTRQLIAEGNLEAAEETAQLAYKTLDKAARKNVVHPRNAARRKGRLMAALAAAKAEAAK